LCANKGSKSYKKQKNHPQEKKHRLPPFTSPSTYIDVTHYSFTNTYYNHDGVGTEHILLAIMSEGEGIGAKALNRLQVPPGDIRAQIEKFHPAVEQPITERQLGLTQLRGYFYLPLDDRIIIVDPENSGIGRFGVELVREDDVEEFVAYRPFLVSFGRIGFALGV
jgi:hypothetical protein